MPGSGLPQPTSQKPGDNSTTRSSMPVPVGLNEAPIGANVPLAAPASPDMTLPPQPLPVPPPMSSMPVPATNIVPPPKPLPPVKARPAE
jgi:hypothetical protein